MSIVYRLLAISVLFWAGIQIIYAAPAAVSLVLQEAPCSIQQAVKAALTKEQNLSEANTQVKVPERSGIVALYAGYSDYSNPDGSITFPLKHNETKIYVVITQEVKPHLMMGNTVQYIELIKGIPAKIYLFERKETELKETSTRTPGKDEITKTFYWEVTEQPRPENERLNQLSLILLTDPQNIVVKTGKSIDFNLTPNFSLPQNIYVVGNRDNVKAISNFLDISQFFESVEEQTKEGEEAKPDQMLISND